MKEPICTVIIPTWNNREYLSGALNSLLRNQTTPGLMRVIVVNNGHKESCDWVKHPQVEVLQTGGKNLMWEGGLDLGLKHTESPFVCFFNDDAFIPPSSRLWLNQLLQHFRDEKVAAVGPSSNVVTGMQNIFVDTPVHIFTSTFLIGFCVLVRRSALDEIGGIDLSLPSGDDFDWSIRFRDKGYKLIIDRDVFVYHHGFKSGQRLMGDHQTMNGWNSYEMQERTNLNLIRKHGLKKWWETMKGSYTMPALDETMAWEDVEGKIILGYINKSDKLIYDLGCGNHKTVKRAVGIDFIKKGERIPALAGEPISEADIQADVSTELPIKDNSADVLIARHVLEHMIDPIFVLSHWIKKLKKGGKLIIALPNQDWILTIPMNFEHLHAFNPSSAQMLLLSLGLKDVKVESAKNRVSFIVTGEKP